LSHTTSTPSGENANPKNLWAKQSLIAIRDIEEQVKHAPDFPIYCWADSDAVVPDSPRTRINPTFSDTKCSNAAFVSPMDLLYFFNMDPALIESYSQDQLDNALQSAIEDPNVWKDFRTLFDKRVNEENIRVEYMRSTVLFGGPIQYKTGQFLENGEPVWDRYNDLSDRYEEQLSLVREFQVKVSNLIEWSNKEYFPTIKRHSYSMFLHHYRFHEVVQQDIMWSVFSVLFVLVYVWFHLKSFFLAVSSLTLIMMSFPLT
jgi:hypothetical protein